MNCYQLLVGLSATLYLMLGSASATEVYRWVDENGVVHYSQNRAKHLTEAEKTRINDQPNRGLAGQQATPSSATSEMDTSRIQLTEKEQREIQLQCRKSNRSRNDFERCINATTQTYKLRRLQKMQSEY